MRLKLDWFQAEALVLYSAGDSLDTYIDAGLVLDAAIFRLSLGAGQSFRKSLLDDSAIRAGLNVKAGAEVLIGKVSAGISYILDLTSPGNLTNQLGLFGINIVLWL